MENFKFFINEMKAGINIHDIRNIEEIQTSFDMPDNFMVDLKGVENTRITTIGQEKYNFTIILSGIANSSKLSMWLILKELSFLRNRYQ